ncbi:uncharacterized protein LOC105428064 [Pogonomyrmex barbatus]|uniref:Uncharacterized protein LOC105428064 n=1 Tax=Pogonomyrmex barbatus TaxID=144034 RepID=A0A6I9W8F3_9HYME|nr:uncharacterized protein LOC105428064 [Pogonomyrmex barbatus]
MPSHRFIGIAMFAVITYFDILLVTDFWDGARDPMGPYPRIPDKDRLEKEIKFAEECKKYYKAPQEVFLSDT